MYNGRLGATDVAAILGLNPPKWRQPIDVWLEARGEVEKSDQEPDRLRLGRAFEEPVIRLFCEDTGREYDALVFPGDKPAPGKMVGKAIQIETTGHHHPYTLINPEIDWLCGTPDAVDAKKGDGIEAKTASPYVIPHWEEDPPPNYIVQCKVYMILTGYEIWHLPVAFGNQEFRIYHTEHDPDLADIILSETGEWHERHIAQGIQPDVTGSNRWTEYLKRKFPRVTREELVQAPAELWDQWVEAKRELEEAKEMLSEVENRIRLEIGDAKGAIVGPARFTWTEAAGSISWKRVAEALAEKYEVPADEVQALVEELRGKPVRRFNTPRNWRE